MRVFGVPGEETDDVYIVDTPNIIINSKYL